MTPPSPSASRSTRAIPTIPPAPFSPVVVSCSTVRPRWTSRSTHATASPARTAHSTLVEPDPSSITPSPDAAPPSARTAARPVIQSPSGIVRTKTASGTTMLIGRGGIVPTGSGTSASSSTSGAAPASNSSPRAARSSARRIGPTAHPVTATTPARTTAAIAYTLYGIDCANRRTGSSTPCSARSDST